MRTSVLAALMAASVLVPAAASAQDDQGRRGGWRGRGEAQGAQPQPQQARDPGRPGGSDRPERPQRDYARPQPQVQAQVQAPAQQARPQPDNGGAWAGREGRAAWQGGRPAGSGGGQGRGEDRAAAPAPQAQPQFQQPQQVRQHDWRDRPRDGFNGDRNGWNRDDRGNVTQAYHGGDQRDDRRNDGRDQRRYDNNNSGRNGGHGYDQRARGYSGYNGGGYNSGYGNRAWSRDWRRDNRYNYSAYRSQNRNAFHLPRYYAPSGWDYGYRRFSVGFTLSSFLYDQDYWIEDADYYRLPPAYGPYRWVRYYNDALLVDLRTGYVVDTVYDIFW